MNAGQAAALDLDGLLDLAASALRSVQQADLTIATAESCTGGFVASLLTDVPDLSGLFERGFVTYSVDAKCDQLGLERAFVERHGAVSRPVALAMAKGALDHSRADIAVAVTGYAGPGGEGEPGLVHVAAAREGRVSLARECRFGDIGREPVRRKAAREALMLVRTLAEPEAAGSDVAGSDDQAASR